MPDPQQTRSTVELRPYTPDDAAPTLDVFERAISETAAADHSPEQLGAWLGERDITEWHAAMHARDSIVAVVDGLVVGFSDVSPAGLIDMMFVHPHYGRRGVGSALLNENLRRAQRHGATELTAHASITAWPFFERHGFEIVETLHPVRGGVEFTNYLVRRPPMPAGA